MEKIYQVKFVGYLPIGPASDSESWLAQGVNKSGYVLTLTATAEGLKIVGNSTQRKGEYYEQFIPIHQIQSYVGPLVKADVKK